LYLATAAAGLAPASAQERVSKAAPPKQEAGEGPAQAEIIVEATPDERTSVDRSTYIVRDNAEARSSSVLDVLARIPSVEVTPNGQLRLLGKTGVKVLIDGSEVANPTVVLRNLQGSQVARIEVISNPSAAFSAQGTAGIINVITRRSFRAGLGGSATANVGSFGAFEAKASPTWSRGSISLSGSLGVTRNVGPVAFVRERRTEVGSGGPVIETLESGNLRNEGEVVAGNLSLTYRPTSRQSVNLNAILVEIDGKISRSSEFLLSSGPEGSFLQEAFGRTGVSSRDFSAMYRRDGRRQGEALSASAKRSTSSLAANHIYSIVGGLGDSRIFRLESVGKHTVNSFNLDYIRPSPRHRRLSLGAVIQRTSSRTLSLDAGDLPLGQGTFTSATSIRGSWLENAAYVTYQRMLIGTTVLAGLRVENRNYDLPLHTDRGAGGMHLFPSLHLERRITPDWTANLSYSRRVTWPGIVDLDPALRFTDSTTANAGNPLLRPEITGSFEAKLKGNKAKQDIEFTLYSRRTRDVQSSLAELDGGVLVTRPVNLGNRLSRGASLSVRGPLGGGFRHSLSGNLTDQRISGGDLGLEPEGGGAQHSASAQIEYRDGVDGRRGADRVEIRARYSGSTSFGLLRVSSYVSANATWSHAFTDRLSGVLTISDFLGPPDIRITTRSGSTLSRSTDKTSGPRFTLSLTYSLKAPSRP
jgi:hypothetical protein